MKKLTAAAFAAILLDCAAFAETAETTAGTTAAEAVSGSDIGSVFLFILYTVAIVALIYVVLLVMNRMSAKSALAKAETNKNTDLSGVNPNDENEPSGIPDAPGSSPDGEEKTDPEADADTAEKSGGDDNSAE